jgi:hypothetical protein
VLKLQSRINLGDCTEDRRVERPKLKRDIT